MNDKKINVDGIKEAFDEGVPEAWDIEATMGKQRFWLIHVISGRLEPTYKELEKLAEIMGVPVEEFYVEEPTPEFKTDTKTLITALRIVARDIQSDDGVAQACIREGAERLEEYYNKLLERGE